MKRAANRPLKRVSPKRLQLHPIDEIAPPSVGRQWLGTGALIGVIAMIMTGCQSPRMTVSDVPIDEPVAITQATTQWTATPPSNWIPKPAGAFLLARFDIPIQTDRVDASVSMLSGGAGGLLGNVNRWRGQLGLAPLTTPPPTQSLLLNGVAYQLVVIRHTPHSMAVYMHQKGDNTWFFKVVGPSRHLTTAQRAMETYIKGGQWE
ncbi:hypothetical protein EBZ35_02850 [bacterium]|nr:hypothetical protein [bacterium]